MAVELIRILSDLHFGDRASWVRSLLALQPLFAGADRIVFNGDSLETRSGPGRRRPDALRHRFLEFVRREAPRSILLTGNHDADISELHCLDLLGGQMFVTHGEVFFDDLVPWSPQRPHLGACYRRQLALLDPRERESLEARLAACKRASAQEVLPAEPHPRHRWRRTMHTVRKFWPPRRTLAMMQAWHALPDRVAELMSRHRPGAHFAVVGHTHLPGVWTRGNLVVINTGSFCPPFGAYAVDVSPREVLVRRVRKFQGRFHPGRVVARFALASDRDAVPDIAPFSAGLASSP